MRLRRPATLTPMPGGVGCIQRPAMLKRFRACTAYMEFHALQFPIMVMGLAAGIAGAGGIGSRPASGGIMLAFIAAGLTLAGGGIPVGDCAAGSVDTLHAAGAGAAAIPTAVAGRAGVVAGLVAAPAFTIIPHIHFCNFYCGSRFARRSLMGAIAYAAGTAAIAVPFAVNTICSSIMHTLIAAGADASGGIPGTGVIGAIMAAGQFTD